MGYLEWDVRDLLAHGEPMSYRIPIGTEAQRLTLPDPITGERAEFFCLPLGENPLGTRGGSRWDEGYPKREASSHALHQR